MLDRCSGDDAVIVAIAVVGKRGHRHDRKRGRETTRYDWKFHVDAPDDAADLVEATRVRRREA
jgi:hypothetical protein